MPGRRNDALIKLAERRMWGEVCATLDRCEAGVDDYDGRAWTALHCAAFDGTVAAIDELVQRGADVNAKAFAGFAPLHTVVWCNQPVAAERLVHHGADLNAKDSDGNTPIENARRYGRTELAAWLAMARARRHWAEARALGRATTGALACAFFWHAHVGEQLCAPGAKWAERDRAAFERDFNRPGE